MKTIVLPVVCGFALSIGGKDVLAANLQSVSGSSRTNVASGGNSFTPSFSQDGHSIVFVSHSRNLATNPITGMFLNVFVRHLPTGTTRLVSVSANGQTGGDANSNVPGISANGRLVVFESASGNLTGNDTNGVNDVFVRDLVAGTTTLVSVNRDGTASGNGSSASPVMTPDGRWIAFESAASDLVESDTNGVGDIFLRDTQNQTTLRISVDVPTNSDDTLIRFETPVLTPDGQRVAFVSTRTNAFSTRHGDVFVRDVPGNLTIWASANVGAYFAGNTNGYFCFGPAMSADGRYVAFKATSRGADRAFLFHHDLQTGNTLLLTTNSSLASDPQLSSDGQYAAGEDGNDVVRWDTQSAANELVSKNASNSGAANGPSHTPVMTPDARYVAFLSAATDLTPEATNGLFQVYLRDLTDGVTRLISRNLAGGASAGNIETTLPALTDDGQQVAFESLADDLVPDDLNLASDIYLRDVAGASTTLMSVRQPDMPALTGEALSGTTLSSLSADGRYVLFSSLDNTLVAGDRNQRRDIFRRDLVTGEVVPVSLTTNGKFASALSARSAVMSPDGRYVAWGWVKHGSQSLWNSSIEFFWRDLLNATTLSTGVKQDWSPYNDFFKEARLAIHPTGRWIAFTGGTTLVGVYVRDMLAGTNQLVSLDPTTGQPIGSFFEGFSNLTFSPDGRWLVFSFDFYSPPGSLYARDLVSNRTFRAAISVMDVSSPPLTKHISFSADSSHLAFVTSNRLVTVHDLFAHANIAVATNCDHPSLSFDGRLVAYETNVSNTQVQILLTDLSRGLTELISVNRTGSAGGNGSSTSPLLTPDGRYIVFVSKASDLVENDSNNATDIFVRDRRLGTTLLVTRNREGTASGNGASSKPVLGVNGRTVVFQSFASDLIVGDYNDTRDVFVLKLGEDSEFTLLTLTSANGGGITILWSATQGQTYRVQFKNNLSEADWTDLPGLVTAVTSAASLTDATTSGQRFYRVRKLPSASE